MFWHGKRASLHPDRGPWKDHRDYVRFLGQRELEWMRRFGRPQRNDLPHNSKLEGKILPEVYVNLLEKYIALSPYILPVNRTTLYE
ncbi:hypothetical protein ASPWEDRAFT_166100 [Aspergillus wentii DTO 134E9]|uniref:Uncharacterized protein n=1 Tax=Aspergillus wentii DTO 134E9 TaxID=1073089 RepID=A0A1L9RYN8_ASPWE|nr:uncharacterized protein ASPWEDRAFT_166100 [Aspergillus wentii DTO 134E9]KAI9932446.1 Phosphotransferase enzyme [Aspergillus wentii]OJJ40013.1 hypothetical protein ASPWEDRAFT_166100 [Aspergillus wentii DTO 134E9]